MYINEFIFFVFLFSASMNVALALFVIFDSLCSIISKLSKWYAKASNYISEAYKKNKEKKELRKEKIYECN